jgi:hypothetical protein
LLIYNREGNNGEAKGIAHRAMPGL